MLKQSSLQFSLWVIVLSLYCVAQTQKLQLDIERRKAA